MKKCPKCPKCPKWWLLFVFLLLRQVGYMLEKFQII